MYGWSMEQWTVRQGGKTVVTNKVVVRNELGQFHGATNFRERIPKKKKQDDNSRVKSGSRVSRRATGLRLVK